MATRTTTTAVKAILLKDYDTINNPDLSGFIESASVVIDRVIQCAARKGITLTTAEQELVERWYAAHLYVQSDATYKSRHTLRASGEFNKNQSAYLDQAVAIDPSGCLENFQKSKSPRAIWLGRRPSAQTDYVDRD